MGMHNGRDEPVPRRYRACLHRWRNVYRTESQALYALKFHTRGLMFHFQCGACNAWHLQALPPMAPLTEEQKCFLMTGTYP